MVENSPCTLGGTCRGTPDASNNVFERHFVNGNDVFQQRYDNNFLQNYDPGNDVFYDDNGFENDLNYDRQTGEEFFSEAQPDCRVICQ